MSDRGAPSDGVFDVTILGGGPTGLFGVFYAGMRHMRTLVIDALSELGGQLTALYPEKYIFDVGGLPKILAKDLVKNMIVEFKAFINKGDVVTIAVGLVMALYFKEIVDSIIAGVITPILAAIFGGHAWHVVARPAQSWLGECVLIVVVCVGAPQLAQLRVFPIGDVALVTAAVEVAVHFVGGAATGPCQQHRQSGVGGSMGCRLHAGH